MFISHIFELWKITAAASRQTNAFPRPFPTKIATWIEMLLSPCEPNYNIIRRFNKLRLYSWWYQLVIKKNSFSDAWFVIYFLINACISSTWNNHKKNYTRCQLIYNDCNDCTSIYIHGPHSIQQGDVLIVTAALDKNWRLC